MRQDRRPETGSQAVRHMKRCFCHKIIQEVVKLENQKRENLLNLALDATREERLQSENLNVGYDPQNRTWELIVRHFGELEFPEEWGVQAERLLAGYGILTVPENRIGQVSSLPQIEYIEKPKRLFFAVQSAKRASCITALQSGAEGLTGRGITVAVIDSGIDYFHPDFRNPDGSSRIVALWDQNRNRIYTGEEIDRALETGSRERALQLVPATDLSGHGTAVAGIAAGNGGQGGAGYRGVAYDSDLLVVSLGTPLADNFPRTTELMRALDYVARWSMERGQPVAVNLSFGNTYGSHDGTSLLETYMDSVAAMGRMVICAGTGNEGSAGGHASGRLVRGVQENVELSVAPYETGFGLQIWKSYADDFQIALKAPSGQTVGVLTGASGPQTLGYRQTRILAYYGEPSPYSRAQEIYLDFLPVRDYLDSGIWTIELIPMRLVTGFYNMWLPTQGILNPGTRFLLANPDRTLTIPSTASRVISVGAYSDAYDAYAEFSGRGSPGGGLWTKPELVAPGVEIKAPRAGGGYQAVTGTSFATPFVTGSAALLMEWGIVRGNDPFLYRQTIIGLN